MYPQMMYNMMGNFGNYSSNSGYPWMYNMMGWTGFGGIFMLLFWALLIIGITVLIKWVIHQNKSGFKGGSAIDTLKERYAKGEITHEEFQKIKREINE